MVDTSLASAMLPFLRGLSSGSVHARGAGRPAAWVGCIEGAVLLSETLDFWSGRFFFMVDFFKSPRSMLSRAKRHYSDVEKHIKSFIRGKPWAMVIEKDVDGVTNVLKVKFSDRLGDDLPNIIFDCANNLRSVLDQTAYAIARKHTGLNAPKSAKFPFGRTEEDLLNNLAGRCKDLPPEIRDFFAAFKPYKRGNNALWGVNELCNAPKHKMIYPVVIGDASLGFGGHFAIGEALTFLPRIWNSEKNEIPIASFPDGAIQGSPYFNVTSSIVFDDVDEVIRGQNPIDVLRAMTGEVERILVATERECRRIKLIE
jgi:hypothetical protein